MSGRDVSLDVAKSVAMFAIVIIHVRTNAPMTDFGLIAGLDNFLTSFVLSLFILVSGYLSRGLILSGDRTKLLRRIVPCVWPILTMMVVLGQLIDLCVLGRFQPPPIGWIRFVLSAGWFFLCLAICLVLTFVLQAASRGRKGVLFLLLAATLVGLWALPVGLCHAKDMIVYFWFGVYAYPAYVCLGRRRAIGFAALAASLAVCLALPDFRTVGLFVHDAVMPPGTFTGRGCALALAKYALGLCSALGVLEVAHAWASRLEHASPFVAVSTQTMGIFFIHIQLLNAYYAMGGATAFGFAGRFALALVLFVVSYVLAVVSHRNRVVGAVLWNPLELLPRKGSAQ